MDPGKVVVKESIDVFFESFDGVILLLIPNQSFTIEKDKKESTLSKFIKILVPQKALFIYSIIASVILTILGIAMPSSYVDMEREEIEYVEGGAPYYTYGDQRLIAAALYIKLAVYKNVVVPALYTGGVVLAYKAYQGWMNAADHVKYFTEFQNICEYGKFREMTY